LPFRDLVFILSANTFVALCGVGGLSLLYTQKYLKIAKVHATAWRFDNEGLVKINFRVKGHEKSLNAVFYYF
jgi:hypothetical protein